MLNSKGGGMHHSLLSPGPGDFTHFHLHKKWGGAGVSNDWCITHQEYNTYSVPG